MISISFIFHLNHIIANKREKYFSTIIDFSIDNYDDLEENLNQTTEYLLNKYKDKNVNEVSYSLVKED